MRVCASCGRESSDEFAFCPHCGAALAQPGPEQEQRKTVTVLFCDIVGSTSLGESTDPEALRALLARYFDRMKAVVDRHGGTVEKFIGDAVMAVFGVPVVHEDDAFRAVRAASEMAEAFSGLGVDGRIGIATGEVVTGTAERLATGDAVNVAARIEQAAEPGAVLLSEETFQLVRNGVEVDALEPLELKGKTNRVAAYRLRLVTGEPSRGIEAPMVGREREQRLLADAWERAVSERSCHLFTMLGPAGVGKSRLVAEFLSRLEPATVVHGRSLPYGEGITYWPAVEVIKQLPGVALDDRAGAIVQGLLEDSPDATSEEIAWAFRKLLEAAAAQRPLICVLDDLHWAEQTFLDLVEHVADLSRGAPIVLLCMARPDLLDRRAGWGGGKINATTVLLEPLGAEETERLIDSLADMETGLAARIREASEGNPLFVEEMVAMVRESPSGEVVVPPTIQALLAARLDQLDQSERSVLQCGSVEGRVFHGGAVEALGSEGSQVVAERLTGLVRKELVRPDTPVLRGEDAYRFRHLLIRDAAYDALPKAARAELHELFADWLEGHADEIAELDEIVGYHLEQAHQYRLSLDLDSAQTDAVGIRAAERLGAAARRAYARGDMPAAVNLFERAAAMWPEDDARRRADLPAFGRALTELGDWEGAVRLLSQAVDDAKAHGEDVVGADATVVLASVRLHMDPDMTHEHVHRELDKAVRVFEEEGDEARLASALALSGTLLFWAGRTEEAQRRLERALRHARRAGDRVQELQCLRYLASALAYGPTPAPAALSRLEELGGKSGTQALAVVLLRTQAHLEAIQGQFELAREHVGAARALAEELGLTMLLEASIPRGAAEIELLADDPAAAERELAPSCEFLERIGNLAAFASSAAYLGDALLMQGRVEEAAPLIERASRWTLADDLDAQIGWRRVQAKILAHAGKQNDAESLGREAVALAEGTDYLDLHAEAYRDLAEVLERGGKTDEAATALEQAVAVCERKGNVVMAERARERLGRLTASRG